MASSPLETNPRIVIIGAGPSGLECALKLLADVEDAQITIFEQGDVAKHISEWEHVSLFSAWSMNMSERGISALKEVGAEIPDLETYPTGKEFREQYLIPVANYIANHTRAEIRTLTKVQSITRKTITKTDMLWGKTFVQKKRFFPFFQQTTYGLG